MVAESIKTLCGEIKRKLKSAATPVFLLALTGIFAWQATQGDHGLIMRERRMAQLAQAGANYSAAKAERAPKAVPSVNAALPCKRRRQLRQLSGKEAARPVRERGRS